MECLSFNDRSFDCNSAIVMICYYLFCFNSVLICNVISPERDVERAMEAIITNLLQLGVPMKGLFCSGFLL